MIENASEAGRGLSLFSPSNLLPLETSTWISFSSFKGYGEINFEGYLTHIGIFFIVLVVEIIFH